MEEIALENDLMMRPKPRFLAEGRHQVYQFGKKSIYWNHDVVFIMIDQDKWEPVNIDNLIVAAKKK